MQADVFPRAERAAHAPEGEPHQFLGQAETLRHLLPIVVQPLGGHDQVDAAVVGRESPGPPRDP